MSVNAYKKTEVVTANKEQILLLMYEGAIKFMRTAIAASQAGDVSERGSHIVRTQDIINELRATLNFEVGGEIATNLESLYAYMTQRLLKASAESGTAELEEVLKILETLSEAWHQAVDTVRKEKVAEPK